MALRWLRSYGAHLLDTADGDLPEGGYAIHEKLMFFRRVGVPKGEYLFRCVEDKPEALSSRPDLTTRHNVVGTAYYNEFLDESTGKVVRVQTTRQKYEALGLKGAGPPKFPNR